MLVVKVHQIKARIWLENCGTLSNFGLVSDLDVASLGFSYWFVAEPPPQYSAFESERHPE
jgi:hypothetical protein